MQVSPGGVLLKEPLLDMNRPERTSVGLRYIIKTNYYEGGNFSVLFNLQHVCSQGDVYQQLLLNLKN